MESTPDTQTPSLWTDEKHLHYLNTMEASFVRTMLHHYAVVSPLRLDRYLPDTSESTLDSKPKKQATAGTPPPRTSLCLLHQVAMNHSTAFGCTFHILLSLVFDSTKVACR
ncbi:hypothetical protein D0Y65_027949 [Glycine soja]|uniref:Uncharacterized protein n=1 Tax=Glycine soja TaxID=3848 RepID=A0A445IS76_GLYSO|nr:hypothetical protein D0Y65_027949 [Glycine soja]RZB88815.1 hypothetical protein D0Y65_027949 [Glycine soja]RZB88816.1 hypothetical protein D0Y65_027949 [Glycine soja]